MVRDHVLTPVVRLILGNGRMIKGTVEVASTISQMVIYIQGSLKSVTAMARGLLSVPMGTPTLVNSNLG